MKPTGKVLKVKAGYNPNSSSIGTEVSAFLWGAATMALVVNTLVGIVAAVREKRTREPAPGNDSAESGG